MAYVLPTKNTHYSFCDLVFDASHVLVGGTTGAGKSVFIDEFLYSALGQYTPDDLKLVLIDPKRVSLIKYKNLPHTIRYETENPDIICCLDDVIAEMENRYSYMQANNLVLFDGGYIVVVIDELADLMTTCQSQVMPRLQRIAQLGRASKIKLLCATQAPNRKVIPAELIVNFTGRVALRCLSAIESKQIINRKGAEGLPQYGKAIYLHSNGRYYNADIVKVDDAEIMERINFWTRQKPVQNVSTSNRVNHPTYSSVSVPATPHTAIDWEKVAVAFVTICVPVLIMLACL